MGSWENENLSSDFCDPKWMFKQLCDWTGSNPKRNCRIFSSGNLKLKFLEKIWFYFWELEIKSFKDGDNFLLGLKFLLGWKRCLTLMGPCS